MFISVLQTEARGTSATWKIWRSAMAEELFPSLKEVDLYRRDLVQLRAPSSRGL
jgi:hypothetical protein